MKRKDIRDNICGTVFFLAFLSLTGLTGEADFGALGFWDYLAPAVVHLLVMGAALLISGVEMSDEKKKVAPDGNQDSDHR